ncbi:MAG: LysM domain-containing protein, partial [Elainellaceae cyanobacterium]
MTSARAMAQWGLYAAAASLLLPLAAVAAEPSAEQNSSATGCPAPVLSRLTEHSVTAGETVDAIAREYTLLPSTLIGLNPELVTEAPAPGATLLIPPYNGVVTRPTAGTTWQDLGDRYGVRADVLFEINGCQEVSDVVFIPGVNWSPSASQVAQARQLETYPLPDTATVLMGYGWQVNAAQDDVEFHSG